MTTQSIATDTDNAAPPGDARAWHGCTVAQVADTFGVRVATGLAADEVLRRAQTAGPNLIRERPPRSPWRVLADQFADFMILVLLAAAVVSGFVGDLKDALAIVVIVLLNAAIGFAQALRAERAIAALKQLAGAQARLLREGEPRMLPASEIVPGDIVLLEAGQRVPADLRLVEAVQLKIDESPMTGEAVPVDKLTEALSGVDLPLGDRCNMAFKGTHVTYGRGAGIAVATGMQTELGRIASLLEASVEPKTPLQRRLTVFGQRLAWIILGICAFIFVTGLLRGMPMALMFLTAVSLAVAAIPEALPAVVTISLALGARKMVRQQALIRRLPAVETLGSVTYVCSDKTGTLTENRMRVVALHAAGITRQAGDELPQGEPWHSLMNAMALSNDASSAHDGRVTGDPTELALFHAARDAGYDKAMLEPAARRVFELPFDSGRKRMTTLHLHPQGTVAYMKGAPESVLPVCVHALGAEGAEPLQREEVLAVAGQMAGEGLRVLAVACRVWPDAWHEIEVEDIEEALVFVGLVGMLDPARPEASGAIALCRSAGIRPVMITGDHPATARAVARQLGMAVAPGAVLTGAELAEMSDAALAERVAEIEVYARVDPAQKIRIVEALQARGEFVAMTGDGVNDAPALRRADIGVAMGKGGTDVAREAASLVLLDDNFATIVNAVREGRRIFDNIRKFVRYVMTGNTAEIWTLFLAPFLGLPVPLQPIQILWVNLLTDGLPGLALAAEPAEQGIMARPPRLPAAGLFGYRVWRSIVLVGLYVAGISLAAQWWALSIGDAHWQSMVFTVLTFSQLALAIALRSERTPIHRHGLFNNPPMLAAVSVSFLAQLAILYIPLFNPIFNTAPLDWRELLICVALAGSVFVLVEIGKRVSARRAR